MLKQWFINALPNYNNSWIKEAYTMYKLSLELLIMVSTPNSFIIDVMACPTHSLLSKQSLVVSSVPSHQNLGARQTSGSMRKMKPINYSSFRPHRNWKHSSSNKPKKNSPSVCTKTTGHASGTILSFTIEPIIPKVVGQTSLMFMSVGKNLFLTVTRCLKSSLESMTTTKSST